MIRLLALLVPLQAFALSPAAREFMEISRELEPRLKSSSDPEDLPAISLQQREAFYRCE